MDLDLDPCMNSKVYKVYNVYQCCTGSLRINVLPLFQHARLHGYKDGEEQSRLLHFELLHDRGKETVSLTPFAQLRQWAGLWVFHPVDTVGEM